MDPRYPIGKFEPKETYSAEEIAQNILRIEAVPPKFENAMKGLTPTQVDTRYRDGGWTLRQVVHHVADSHMNAYIRIKWTLTEDTPLIKAYNEQTWAETPEVKIDPALSIQLLKVLHVKFVLLLRSLSPADLKREFVHPETNKNVPLARLTALYAWHGEHHLAHITTLKAKMNW